jgi:hypothetical protein
MRATSSPRLQPAEHDDDVGHFFDGLGMVFVGGQRAQ